MNSLWDRIVEADTRHDDDAAEHESARRYAAHDELVAALRQYVATVQYLQRTTNPEEWATHGDWQTLEHRARAAMAKAEIEHE